LAQLELFLKKFSRAFLRLPLLTPNNPPEPTATPENSVLIASVSVAEMKAKLDIIDTCFPENETLVFEQLTNSRAPRKNWWCCCLPKTFVASTYKAIQGKVYAPETANPCTAE